MRILLPTLLSLSSDWLELALLKDLFSVLLPFAITLLFAEVMSNMGSCTRRALLLQSVPFWGEGGY